MLQRIQSSGTCGKLTSCKRPRVCISNWSLMLVDIRQPLSTRSSEVFLYTFRVLVLMISDPTESGLACSFCDSVKRLLFSHDCLEDTFWHHICHLLFRDHTFCSNFTFTFWVWQGFLVNLKQRKMDLWKLFKSYFLVNSYKINETTFLHEQQNRDVKIAYQALPVDADWSVAFGFQSDNSMAARH